MPRRPQDFVKEHLSTSCESDGSADGSSAPACNAKQLLAAWRAASAFACTENNELLQCEPPSDDYILGFLPTSHCA